MHAATAIEAARLHERTSEMARTDTLTGLANRRQLDEDLQAEAAATARYHRPLREEFALVLRETDAAGASVFAERVRAAVEHRFPIEPRALTVSIGVIAAADAALYDAKAAGRNQVCTAIHGSP